MILNGPHTPPPSPEHPASGPAIHWCVPNDQIAELADVASLLLGVEISK
jgi:hypothetical protein